MGPSRENTDDVGGESVDDSDCQSEDGEEEITRGRKARWTGEVSTGVREGGPEKEGQPGMGVTPLLEGSELDPKTERMVSCKSTKTNRHLLSSLRQTEVEKVRIEVEEMRYIDYTVYMT